MHGLQKIIEELRGANVELADSNKGYFEKAGYFRPCQPNERVADALKEATEHGSVVCYRSSLFCIMPKVIPGWTKYPGPIQQRSAQ